jgi:hypothetical protein
MIISRFDDTILKFEIPCTLMDFMLFVDLRLCGLNRRIDYNTFSSSTVFVLCPSVFLPVVLNFAVVAFTECVRLRALLI